MAMLAEPRQRKRYNLTPRGKALYEDDTRFGTKMLEKMGWSKGKGLGANENGRQDFVRVRMRNTNEGLGYEDRDDNWTQHEQCFNGLLKSLNDTSEDSGKASETKESASAEELLHAGLGFAPVEKFKDKISGVSLEEKSKMSKSRVHYKKFTRGKDIAQYSEKDLANIFGKKAAELEQADGIYAELTAITARQKRKVEEKQVAGHEKDVNPNLGGVQMISAGLSVSDYFKQKMEAMKSKQKQNNVGNIEQSNNEGLKDGREENVPLKDKKKSKRKREETGVDMEKISIDSKKENNERHLIETIDLTQGNCAEEYESPKKKCKDDTDEKNKNKQFLNSLNNESANTTNAEHKKKAKKSKDSIAEKCCEVVILDEDYNEEPKKKKKSKKSKVEKKDKIAQDEERTLLGRTTMVGGNLDEVVVSEKKMSKTKENSENVENVTDKGESRAKFVKPVADTSSATSSKKSKKQKQREKDVQVNGAHSGSNKQVDQKPSENYVSEEIPFQSLTLDKLIAKCNSFNVYTVSSFCAEKFRNVDLDRFNGATLPQFPGYSYNEKDLKLNVEQLPSDEKRITQLWNCTINKYQEAKPTYIFGKYKHNVVKVLNSQNKKENQKKRLPRFYMKSLKRKNVFQSI